jgi:colanic acid/amylovoran biosynthesis glycosyltransferase
VFCVIGWLTVRLGYLVSQYPAINHTFILREIQTLRNNGFDIVVVSVRAPDRSPDRLAPEERAELPHTTAIKSLLAVRLLSIHLAVFVRRPIAYLRGLSLAWTMGAGFLSCLRHLVYFAQAIVAGRLFEEEGIGHFHVHFSSTVGLLAAEVFRLSMSNTFHGPQEFVDPLGFHLREKVERSRFVVAISSFGRSQIMKSCAYREWRKVELARLGVDPAVFTAAGQREDRSPVALLTVGRLAPVKGQHILLDAVARLRAAGHPVCMRLAGDGPDRSSLEEHTAALGLTGSVVFEGWCSQETVLRLYQDTGIFVMASFAEGIPVVLMEAMAMEIPCVATYVAGIPELIEDGITGFLVPASDTDALANAISRLIDDRELASRLGAAGRCKVLADFNLEKNTRELAAIFTRYLSAPRHSSPSAFIRG